MITFHQEIFDSENIFMFQENISSELIESVYDCEQEIREAIKLIEPTENFDPTLSNVLNVYLNSLDVLKHKRMCTIITK